MNASDIPVGPLIVGAVLSFASSRAMPVGHVAMVSKIVNDREVLLTHANLPWVLMLAITARAVTFDAAPVRAPLARPAAGAYQNRPRIASDYVNGRRPLRF